MRHNLARAMLLMACGVAACDSGGNAAPDTLGTTPPTAKLPPATTTTVETATTPSTTVAADAIGLSPDGPWRKVDSAPGVTQPGLVYQLMEGLWVWLPVVEDVPNGITWVLNEADRPIIEAYLQARLVFYTAVASNPMDFTAAGWEAHYVDGGQRLKNIFEPEGQQGYVADMSAGVVLRPTVAGEERDFSNAVVLDCTLDGAVLRDPSGAVGPGSREGVYARGLAVAMKIEGGGWKLDRITEGEGVACV